MDPPRAGDRSTGSTHTSGPHHSARQRRTARQTNRKRSTPWPSHPSESASASAATSPPPAPTPTTRSSGSGATPGSPTSATARWPSSSSGSRCPRRWSLNATNILAQKYFRGTLGTAEREWSLRQVADRVVDTITAWGIKDGYFVDDDEAEAFSAELKHLIVHQMAAFNSPVWFNIGVAGVPQQGSACFILAVEDTMDSILNWYSGGGRDLQGRLGRRGQPVADPLLARVPEGRRHGVGPGELHARRRRLGRHHQVGGKTRRAAKMVILDADHPDIEDFIWCKAIEERKARVLRDAGFDMDLDGKDADQPAVPERQQLGAGHRRVHAGRHRRRATGT